MKTTIEIEIPDEIIAKAVQEMCWATFQRPNWGNQEGAGAKLIRKQVEDHIATLDLRSIIVGLVEATAQQTAEEVVREKLRKFTRESLTKLLAQPSALI